MQNSPAARAGVGRISAPQIDEYVSAYRNQLEGEGNEQQRKEQFLILLTQLFPNHVKQIRAFASGAETYIRVDRDDGKTIDRGFIDTFFGNLVIEFEHDLNSMLKTACQQLKGYVAKLWTAPPNFKAYICVATDGARWKIYSPVLKDAKSLPLTEEDVDLIYREEFVLDNNSPSHFYAWLDRILFRDNSLTPDSEQICRDFGLKSHAFAISASLIEKRLADGFDQSDVRAAYDTWQQYLKYTYGNVTGSNELFIRHSYLSAVTKILMGNVLAAKRGTDLSLSDLRDVMTGDFFLKLNIKNYVDRDFFYWLNTPSLELEDVWVALFNSLKTYDFSDIKDDFLKGVYQDLVDPADRHDLGEYYTPDWLCEKVTFEVLQTRSEDLPRIADVTCGSGSFLRAAINYYKKHLSLADKKEGLSSILNSIIGFEVHPLAVFVAKTNYILSLGDLVDVVESPISIPVYLCDSLLVTDFVEDDGTDRKTARIRLGSESFSLPYAILTDSAKFDRIIEYADSISHSWAREEASETAVRDSISKVVGELLDDKELSKTEVCEHIFGLVSQLRAKILAKRNTIWSFILKNNYRPVFLAHRFDVIVGNPPWLSFRCITDENYKKEVEYLGITKYGIAPADSELRTHTEMATVFLAHAAHEYLAEGGTLAFVMPRSIFSAAHHSSVRDQSYSVDFHIDEIWDLLPVAPLFNVPSCVIIGSKGARVPADEIPGRVVKGDLPRQNIPLAEAQGFLEEEKDITWHVSRMAGRTALSREVIEITSGDEYYRRRFRQGADLMPRTFFFVDLGGKRVGREPLMAETEATVLKNAKEPWRAVKLRAMLDPAFVFRTCIAENVLPFLICNPHYVHLPVIVKKGVPQIIRAKDIELLGAVHSAKWFRKVAAIYEDKKTTRAKSLYEMIDYNGKLLAQKPNAKFWVLFCSSGKNACAAVVENNGKFFADQQTYWFCSDSEDECHYLAGVLNSPFVNETIKPFQSKGLLGERHVHKKILDVGIPKYDPDNKAMLRISAIAKGLSAEAVRLLSESGKKMTLGRRRTFLRESFGESFRELDGLVKGLLASEKGQSAA